MRICDNCEEQYDERDGAFGLCGPCNTLAGPDECGDDCDCGGSNDE